MDERVVARRVRRRRRVLTAAAALVAIAVAASVATLVPGGQVPLVVIDQPHGPRGESEGANASTVVVAGAAVSVPVSWHVIDVDADGGTCPAFDAPAVYLHVERASDACPAPLPATQRAVGIALGDAAATPWAERVGHEGEPVAVGGHEGFRRQPHRAAELVEYLVPELGVVLQASMEGDPSTVERVLHSLRPADAADLHADAAARRGTPMSDCLDLPPADARRAVAGWASLPQPPFVRARATRVWTGEQLFYFAGDTEYGGVQHNDAAAFHVAEGAWRCLPVAPVPGRTGGSGVWTGVEVLLWGGRPHAGGAAYHPATGTWRRLPDPPIPDRVAVAGVWTGKQMIVWGSADRDGPSVDGAAYDPKADRWERLPDAPLPLNVAGAVWTGAEMIVVGAYLDLDNASATARAVGLAYEPATATWRELAPTPLSPQASTLTWTGQHVLAADYLRQAALYDPRGDQWDDAPPVPFEIGECHPDSAPLPGAVFAWFCHRAALFDLGTQTWTTVEYPGEPGRPVSAGGVVLLVGATHEGEHNGLWLYEPGSPE